MGSYSGGMPASPTLEQAQQFGRYRLTQQLGAGGMAVVWRAVVDGPEGFARSVVLKRILPELSQNPRFVKMFLAEARLCALLHHPGIVQVHDLGEVDGEYFLAMEFVDGHDLSNVLRRATEMNIKMPPGLACYVALSLAEALAYAHELRDPEGRPLEIVHRDVSPSNVMLTNLGTVKLLDFGIAKAASHVRDERTRTGTLKGKISYMSPEQADGRKIDKRSDVFALGIVLYECLTGARMFRGEDDFETLRLIREAKVFPPSSERPEIDPDIDAVVLKMLARTPEQRQQTCDELAAALQPIVHRHHADAGALRQFLNSLGPMPSPTTGYETTTPGKRSSASASPPPSQGGTVTRSQGELRPSQPSGTGVPRSRAGLYALAGGVAAGALGLVLYLQRGPAPEPKIPPPPLEKPVEKRPVPVETPKAPVEKIEAPVESARPLQKQTPKAVHLAVHGTAGAEVLLDGVPVGKVPLELDLPAIAGTRALSVQRSGYQPWTKTVGGDHDETLNAALKRKSARPGGEPDIKDPFQ
jgi:serine/threonine protein kinase